MANGLPGKRVDAYLAGIIAMNFIIYCFLFAKIVQIERKAKFYLSFSDF